MSQENIAPVLPDTERLQRAADILKTVAHPARLKIIDFLEGGGRAVAEISRHLAAAQPYVSQQLTLMKSKGILSSKRLGTQVIYSIANQNVVKVIHCVRSHGGNSESAESCAAKVSMED